MTAAEDQELFVFLWPCQARLAGDVMFSTCLSVSPSVRSFILLLTNLWPRCFENEWIDYDANWYNWSMVQGYKTVNLDVSRSKVKLTRSHEAEIGHGIPFDEISRPVRWILAEPGNIWTPIVSQQLGIKCRRSKINVTRGW